MKMRKASTIKKQLREIIIQGNNTEIQNLFVEIVLACHDEFREDNEPTLAGFLTENLYDAIIAKDASLRDCIRRAMILELSEPDPVKDPEKPKIVKLKLVNTYKLFFEQSSYSATLYEWSNGEKSYFTNVHEHHYFDLTGKYCLGGTLEEATACIEKQLRELNII
jgi:hypothetical protein